MLLSKSPFPDNPRAAKAVNRGIPELAPGGYADMPAKPAGASPETSYALHACLRLPATVTGVVDQRGFEPLTLGLQSRCSTTELLAPGRRLVGWNRTGVN